MRALAVFTVSYGSIRVRVRVLPSVADVDRACLTYEGRKRRSGGKLTHGYFVATRSVRAHYIGTVTLAADSDLLEDIPHEIVHAAMHKLQRVERDDDEPLAYHVGVLTSRIHRRLRKLGLST